MDMEIAYASFGKAAQFNWLPWNNPLTYNTGWSMVTSFPSTLEVCLCVNTPAQPYLLASVYRVYSLVVSGYFRIGANYKVSFCIWKEISHCLSQTNLQSCAYSFVKGLAMSENCGTTFLYYLVRPRNCFISLGELGLCMLEMLSSFSGSCCIPLTEIKCPK